MASRGKATIRDLSRRQPTSEDVAAIRQRLSDSGPPIVTAILGQALVEAQLETLLRSRFKRKDDSTWGLLTSETGPLSSFAAKITSGYAFGLYDEATKKNLNIVKDVRNAFAHTKAIIDFDNQLVAEKLEEIIIQGPRRRPDVIALESARKKNNGQTIYMVLCLILYTRLVQRTTRSHVAATRNYGRRKLSPLVAALMGSQTGFLKEAPQLFAGYQIGDPTAPTQTPNFLLSLLGSQLSGGSKNK